MSRVSSVEFSVPPHEILHLRDGTALRTVAMDRAQLVGVSAQPTFSFLKGAGGRVSRWIASTLARPDGDLGGLLLTWSVDRPHRRSTRPQ